MLALLEILQTGGTHTAGDLAARLEVDERTVRRYVEHLLDLDIAVRAGRGRYGGYRLAPGHRMPPLMLTDDEALAVLLGLLTAHRSGYLASSRTALESATAKVRQVLPSPLRTRLDAVIATLGFTATRPTGTLEVNVLLAVAEAARARHPVTLTHRSADGRNHDRVLHPDAVVAHAGHWYVTGIDPALGQERTFRLDRISSVHALPAIFGAPNTSDPNTSNPDTSDPAERLLVALARAPRRHAVSILVQATPDHINRRAPHGLALIEQLAPGDPTTTGDPWVRLRLQVEELGWVPSLLAWIDRPFMIEEPPALHDHVHALAQRLVRSADTTPS